MAIVHVGPLSRWYARSGGDPARLRVGVEAWREDLRAAVADKVGQQLLWDEGSTVAVSFDIGEAGWMALRLFALYAEKAEFDLPDAVPPLLELDGEWRAAADEKFAKSKFGQVLACSVWLPGDFPVTFRVPMPDGEALEVGSVGVVADQLKWLNGRTFGADAAAIAGWSEMAAPAGGELIAAARRGYSGLTAAVAVAVRERLPVVVAL